MSGDLRMGDVMVDVSQPVEGLSGRELEVQEEVIAAGVARGDVALVGFPYDEGVRRNGGRVGAADAPAAAWQYVARAGCVPNPETGLDIRAVRLVHTGDIPPGRELEVAHDHLAARVHRLLAAGGTPLVVGGGNDQSYANARGLIGALGGETARAAVVNVDAHLDVRPPKRELEHSGSPFRQLLEDRNFTGRFVEYAAQGSQCSAEHADYVRSRGGVIYWLKRDVRASGDAVRHFEGVLADLRRTCDRIFLSFDIDSIRGADCPGVSCPGVEGLTADEALEMMFVAGQEPNVCLVDMSEYNPRIERDRTGRLVAAMIYHFMLGRAVLHTRSGMPLGPAVVH